MARSQGGGGRRRRFLRPAIIVPLAVLFVLTMVGGVFLFVADPAGAAAGFCGGAPPR